MNNNMNDTPTPRTNRAVEKHWGDGFAAMHLKPFMQQLERELTAVTEQRYDLFQQLNIVTIQRDRLAEALQSLIYCISATRGSDATQALINADKALQTLNPEHSLWLETHKDHWEKFEQNAKGQPRPSQSAAH